MGGPEIQTTAAILSLMKVLFGNDTFLVAACVCAASVLIVPSILAYKAIRILAGQIAPLREEITASSRAFSELVNEIRNQRDENKQIMYNQNTLVTHVVELVERVTRRLTQLETGGRER